ncbi:hypothetical protein H0H92_001189, partial [Tricholoma furcatifolium]
ALQRAFETIAINPQKARYVRFLAVEAMATGRPAYTRVEVANTRIAAKAVPSILPKLTSLTHLHLKFNPSTQYHPVLRNEVKSVVE